MGRCDGAAPLLTHHRVVLSAPAEDGWGPPSQRSPVQPVRPEGTAGMPKRPFPRPGVCVTGVSRPATMAIPFLAADTGVTSGLCRVIAACSTNDDCSAVSPEGLARKAGSLNRRGITDRECLARPLPR